MYPGFEFNQNPKPQNIDYQQQKHLNQASKPFTVKPEHKHLYNFKAPPFEEPAEGFSIPPQILELFDAKDKANIENRNKVASRTSVTSTHSTVDSRAPFANVANNQVGPAAPPMNQNTSGMKFPSFNTLLNQSNDFLAMKNVPGDLNTSNLSNNMSLNNISRDSRTDSRVDLNTSNRRNTSSRANPKTAKNYQVTLNEDISLIERIETLLNQITLNHNKSCPFCSKVIDIKKCNFQNISAFMSNTSKKYYLTHFDCYLKSNSNPASAKIMPLLNITEARVNSQINSLSNIDTSNFLRSDRRAYFVSIEGYHPISSYLLFRIDKICHGLEHATHRNQLLYLNLSNKTTSIFEPTSYMIPFSEFRLIVTIHMSHANEDPYCYEYLVDFSQVKLSSEQKSKFAEVICSQDGNNILIASQIVYDPNSELAGSVNYKINLDTSFQSTGSTTPSKPDFGKNVFIVLKHFSINLPLKRIERRSKEAQVAAAPVVEENVFAQQQKQSAQVAQKKPHSRLQLNPNAPLFSNMSNQTEQQGGQPFVPPQGQTNMPPGFNKPGFEPQQMSGKGPQQPGFENTNQPNFQGFNNNMYFPPGFHQNQPFDQQNVGMHLQPQHESQSQFQDYNLNQPFMRAQSQGPIQSQMQGQPRLQNSSSQSEMMPPGLGLPSQGGLNQMGYPNFPPQMYPTQQGGDLSKNKSLPGDVRQPQGYQGFQNAGQGRNFEEGFEGRHEGQPILPPEIHYQEEPHYHGEGGPQEEIPYSGDYQAETFKPEKETPPMMERGRGNRPANLYTAVLSGRVREDSASNSPSLHNMQNRYFSAASTPRSEYDQTANTPLSQGNNDFLGGEEASNPPLSEEMIENFRLEDHVGELVEFAKTYNGSRILQKFFPTANQNQIEVVIREIEDKLEELMLDPYANYMFQTLAQSCSGDQRYFLLKKISPSMVEIACDRKGTHSLQALIALVSRDVEENLLRDTLKDHIVELSFDPQGTHLIQKLIVSISLNNIGFIFEPLVERFVEVANHSFGLCVLKQLITKVEKSPELKKRLIKLLYDNLENLIQNPYGNYALQHALEIYQNECSVLFEKTFDKIVQYSNQKFSSNVIEKCLVVAAPEYKKVFVKELTKNDRMIELMKNKYGNFVLLKALKSVDTEDRQLIMQSIMRNLNSVSMAKYKNSWAKFIEENPLRVPGITQPVKHSIFRQNSSGQNEPSGNVDVTSPKSMDPWKDAQKGGAKDLREEKSQFYYGSNKEGMGGLSEEMEKGMMGGNMGNMMREGELGDDDREARILKENVQEARLAGMKEGQQMGAKKPLKSHNQKFYDDKNQHYQNKWGFNNFY